MTDLVQGGQGRNPSDVALGALIATLCMGAGAIVVIASVLVSKWDGDSKPVQPICVPQIPERPQNTRPTPPAPPAAPQRPQAVPEKKPKPERDEHGEFLPPPKAKGDAQ